MVVADAPWRLINRNRLRYFGPWFWESNIELSAHFSVSNFKFLMDTLDPARTELLFLPDIPLVLSPWRRES
jgi:hypothetical protein